MTRTLLLTGIILTIVAFPVLAQEEKDVDGATDHPLLTRMPGFYLSAYETKEFDSYDSGYSTGETGPWEGKLTKISYTIKSGATQVSMLQIGRNYANAIKKIGGKILLDDGRVIIGRIDKNGAVTHVQASAFNDGRDYQLVLVESKPMRQDVVADAAALNQSIASDGKVAVYGIFFDTGKSTLKPESEPTMVEITRLLQQHPGLQLFVVGHTDNVGSLDPNLKLSADRADAVVKALVSRGIAATRLRSAGVGPYCPVTSNATDEGKAKNRRVELVAQK